ncbi:transporter substrate-binding domain-containing protein [Lichenibacterium minor]|uniref:Transporter substrate-binding domain-containing protein n=1 Tax=Lichenibacterium minor TaxID=2316528 RepID=A0A4Q2U1L5_9HYPH|nr:transporter substrate-binding domain-containing protein [Lichenibacterium minor]RYC30182.1 transporter substrate-binding domain-containing protein [Lichenibacterium minor]
MFPANDGLLAAVAAGDVDVTFTNATAERARSMDFSDTFMDVQKSFLVPDGSPLTRQEDFRRPGLRVGVSQGSSTAT